MERRESSPDPCEAVASLCVPYYTIDRGLDHTLSLVDRKLYPESEFPYGQWEYMRFYEENFPAATDPMDANVRKFLKLAFRKGDPSGEHKRAATSMARKGRGLFGSAEIPDVPRDGDVVSEEDLSVYASALERNGFFGPSSWYMNHKTNEAYGRKAANDGNLDVRVLFIAALYDYVCESVHSRLASRCDSIAEISKRKSSRRATGLRRKNRSK